MWDIRKRVEDCIAEAYKRHVSSAPTPRMLIFNVYGYKVPIDASQVMYIETSPIANNKIEIHAKTRLFEFSGRLGELEKSLSSEFFRCHESYIINLNQIDGLDAANKNVMLKNGEMCPVSRRMYPALLERLGIEHQENPPKPKRVFMDLFK